MSKELETGKKLHEEYESLLLHSDSDIFSGASIDVIDKLEDHCNRTLTLCDKVLKLARKYARRLG